MGIHRKEGTDLIFQQDDGQVTARFTDYEEKSELSHEGLPGYRKAFTILVLCGLVYLAYVFFAY